MLTTLELLPGIQVNALNLLEMNQIVTASCHERGSRIMANHNLHSIYLYYHDINMRAFYQVADYVLTDGMGVVLLARLLGVPLRRENRVTYVDWRDRLLNVAVNSGWRIFYLGSKPGVADRGPELLPGRLAARQIPTARELF